MQLYDELIWRGLIKDVSDEEKAREAFNNRKVKFYCGFDPTGKSLTVGHLVQVVRMRLLQLHGHTPVVLIGGATGLIGDPRQESERKLLSLEESLANASDIKKQLSKYLDSKDTIFVNNHDWISKIDLITFLRDIGKNFNINYMINKETVKARLDVGISYTEFSYMIIQAIDFLHLYKTQGVTVQFGGSDQWGNITSGLELIRKTVGETECIGLVSPLLLKSDGQKFGKSESGALWLDENLTTPYEIYQYFLNTTDSDVIKYLKTLTLLEPEKIMELEQELLNKPELRTAQKVLAYEVTSFIHKEVEAKSAIRVSESLFKGDFKDLNEKEFSLLANTLECANIYDKVNIIDVLLDTKLVSSKREAKEMINNGAIYANDEKIASSDYLLNIDIAYFNRYIIIRKGKKKYAMVTVGDATCS